MASPSSSAKTCFAVTLLVSMLGLTLPLCGQQTINLMSGSGTIGSPDPNLRRLDGPSSGGPFTAAFTINDFLAAQTGPQALIVSPAGGWVTSIPSVPGAQWVATGQSILQQFSALYAIDFTVNLSTVTAATLDIWFACDDVLGDTFNEGLFVNGMPVPNSRAQAYGAWGMEQSLLGLDIRALVAPSVNTLFINASNVGAGAGGLLFGATIRLTAQNHLSAPLPLSVGNVGLVLLRTRPTLAGEPYLILPAVGPPAAAGSGIPLANGTEFLLSPSDPFLLFALLEPSASVFFTGLTGVVSPFNFTGAVMVSVPNLPALQGASLHWQALVTPAGGVATMESSNALTTVIL